MIEHLKSGLSISTHVGCPMGCEYCVLSVMNHFSKKPELSECPEVIVKKIVEGKCLFANGKTPLIINNRTDPLLPTISDYTLRLLELLAENHISSPVIIISKFAPGEYLRSYFDRMNLMYIYSYSGYKKDFNYDKLNADIAQIDDIVPHKSRFHYLRPIIPGFNDDINVLYEIIKRFMECDFYGSIMAGFRVNKDNKGLLQQSIKYNTQHKLLSNEIYQLIIDRLQVKKEAYQIFRHTSCGISTFMHASNRLNYFDRTGHCNIKCANRNICKSNKGISPYKIKGFMEEYLPKLRNWEYMENEIHIYESVSQEEIAFIRNALGIIVYATDVRLSESERAITNE